MMLRAKSDTIFSKNDRLFDVSLYEPQNSTTKIVTKKFTLSRKRKTFMIGVAFTLIEYIRSNEKPIKNQDFWRYHHWNLTLRVIAVGPFSVFQRGF